MSAIVVEYRPDGLAATTFAKFYSDFFNFEQQVLIGLKQDGLRLIQLQKARGVVNQDLIDCILN